MFEGDWDFRWFLEIDFVVLCFELVKWLIGVKVMFNMYFLIVWVRKDIEGILDFVGFIYFD